MTQEAIRIPSAGAIFWAEAVLTAGTATPVITAQAIAGAPPAMQVTGLQLISNVVVSGQPTSGGLKTVASSRGLAILCPQRYYDHQPSETELATLAPPTVAAMTVSGTVTSLDGRFHPRQFSVKPPAPVAPSYVPLFPSAQATRIGEAGAVELNLAWQDAAPTPASWAILQLVCTRNGASYVFYGQADVNGDVIVPLTGLPPLPPSQTSPDRMTITVYGDPAQSGSPAANPDNFKAVAILIGGNAPANQIITVTRGQISTLATLGQPGASAPGLAAVTLQPPA